MASEQSAPGRTPPMSKPWSPRKRVAVLVAVLALVYLATAYLILPLAWKRYAHRHPALEDIPNITFTANKIPGDPLNVASIGTETQVKKILLAAKWYPADPITLRSCLKIASDAVLKRPYDDAPISSLYLFGRREDLAFEQPVGDDPRRRHHVRFWRSEEVDPDGRPVWVGAAIHDMRVGLSRTTGQITHHTIADFHKVRDGRNGGGDPWHTDGDLHVGVIDYR